jgi:sugar phosphate isomerase/epimerase
MNFDRRGFLKNAAAMLAASAVPLRAAGERYLLGCQTLPYRAYPLPRALQGISKAGYRYVMLSRTHQNAVVFAPSLSAAKRAELRAQLKDFGLTPFMSFATLNEEIYKPEGLRNAFEELDLCAEFDIRTVIGTGPWYYTKFPNIPMRAKDWQKQSDQFFAALEKVVRHAETAKVTVTLKPHTGVAATAAICLQALKRLPSERFRICWDAGNVSFYEGIYPDPDLPDLAPNVAAVCIKDHLGLRGQANFPVPGGGQIDHELMFRTLFGAGFHGPIAVERVDGTDKAAEMAVEVIDQRITAARAFLVPVLDRTART